MAKILKGIIRSQYPRVDDRIIAKSDLVIIRSFDEIEKKLTKSPDYYLELWKEGMCDNSERLYRPCEYPGGYGEDEDILVGCDTVFGVIEDCDNGYNGKECPYKSKLIRRRWVELNRR